MLKCQKQLLLSNIFVRLGQIVQLQIMQGIYVIFMIYDIFKINMHRMPSLNRLSLITAVYVKNVLILEREEEREKPSEHIREFL